MKSVGRSHQLHHFENSPPTGPPVGFFVSGDDFEAELGHLQRRRESYVFAFSAVFPMIFRQILRGAEVADFSTGEAKVGETHKKSDLLIFGIEKRDSPLARKICCNRLITKPLIKNPTGVGGSFSCNNPAIFKVKLWRKWPFFRFFRNFRKMVVFPARKTADLLLLSRPHSVGLKDCSRNSAVYFQIPAINKLQDIVTQGLLYQSFNKKLPHDTLKRR